MLISMTTQRDYRLTTEELKIIEHTIKHDKRPYVRQRAMAIHLLHQGYGPTQVAEMLAVTRRTIYNWYERWRSAGLAGLADRPGRGRKRKATDEYCHLLEEALEREPSSYGYEFGIWTVGRLLEHLYEQTGIDLSANRLSDLMKDLDYVYRRPKHDLRAHQNPAVVAEAQQALDGLKKKPKPVKLSSSLWTNRR